MIFKRKRKAGQLDKSRLPRHIAIIMDGNGRWAKKKGLPRRAGHAVGAENFRAVATHCKNLGIEYLTVYAFSTENWKRPPDEINAIMGLLEKYLHEAIGQMERDRVKMKFFGDTTVLSTSLQQLIAETEEISSRFNGVQVNICLNYGGRGEILRAVTRYIEDQTANVPALDEATFSSYLYSTGIPDPDLVIRPSGEFRISNFLLWQSAYSEFYFSDILWPDFGPREVDRAIVAFQTRDRRFGGV